jgi:hypothetical protein
MTNRSNILVLSAVPLVLAACSSTSEKSSYVEPQRVGEVVSIQPDDEYVSRVEQMARSQGIQVRWINVPNKRVVANSQ